MPTKHTRSMSVKFDQGRRTRPKRLAASLRRTPHWILGDCVAQNIDRQEKRETFRKDTIKAWEEYQTT